MPESTALRGTIGLGIGGHHKPYRGETLVWLTPPELLQRLGRFDLDPCACPAPRPWSTALEHVAPPDNGLAVEWWGRVWCNPPYGPEVGVWLHRLGLHGHGTALLFARTDTSWWHEWVVDRASALLFLRGRLHFHHTDGRRSRRNAGGPSVLVAYGPEDAERLRDLSDLGWYLDHA